MTMLTEYSHYLLSFHDEFVEAIARGLWVETSKEALPRDALSAGHPFNGLTHLVPDSFLETAGLRCAVYANPRPIDLVEHDARLCSQKLLEIVMLGDGSRSVSWTLDLRTVAGKTRSTLRSYFGTAVRTFDGVAGLGDIRDTIFCWMVEVAERRRKMGLLD
ncbi:MAG: hypothetical protein AAGA56_04245 [Myxococcota bacterium]